jgi:hypothetical protein
MNSEKRDARVAMAGVTYKPSHKMGLVDSSVRFMKYLAAGEMMRHEDLVEKFGDDYGPALVDGDPEIDFERVGRELGKTETVYLSADGEVRYAPPSIVEVIMSPEGEELERREPKDVAANVDDEIPVAWTGKKFNKSDAVRKFAFSRTVQLSHVDGLTYDFLFKMAQELHNENKMVLVGGGSKGKSPLVFQVNGSQYRGFLEGRVNGEQYKLLLHLSNLELKIPEEK